MLNCGEEAPLVEGSNTVRSREKFGLSPISTVFGSRVRLYSSPTIVSALRR